MAGLGSSVAQSAATSISSSRRIIIHCLTSASRILLT